MASQINSTPLATAKAFLACIKSRSKDTLTSIVHPDATGCLIRDGKPNHLKLSRVFDRILAVDSGIEMDEISHDEIEHVDGDFASCWTPYNFFENGKLHHTGTNTFTLWKDPERGWLVTAVADVARAEEGVTEMHIIGGGDREPVP